MQYYQISWEDALHLVQNRRYCISPNGGFLTQIKVHPLLLLISYEPTSCRNTRQYIKRALLSLHIRLLIVQSRGGREAMKTTKKIPIGNVPHIVLSDDANKFNYSGRMTEREYWLSMSQNPPMILMQWRHSTTHTHPSHHSVLSLSFGLRCSPCLVLFVNSNIVWSMTCCLPLIAFESYKDFISAFSFSCITRFA